MNAPDSRLVERMAARPAADPAQLYAKRVAVFPRKIDGAFRRFKWAVMALCLVVYWGTPWLRWDRGVWAPHQAVLIDLAHRRFYMFAIEIWPHEFYFVAGLLIMAGIGLFLVTSVVGRAWCGYACPQTVWTDLYQHVDRFIDGDRNAQLRLQNVPWGSAKLGRRALKWAIYLIIAFLTGGAWIFYFADAPTLSHEFWTGSADPVAYGTTAVLTVTTFVLGGFMREQVCIYMCPWPRIQSAMLDEKSLLVTYKHWRGEPRGSLKSAQRQLDSGLASLGDCIDCLQCVAVCPTGIDIREGAQIGCITCGLCIDACDSAMAQVGRPRGLIDYCTLEDSERAAHGQADIPVWRTILRPRTLIYFTVWAAIGAGLLFMLGTRTRLALSVAKNRSPEYVQLSGGAARDGFTVKVRNMEDRPRPITLTTHWPANPNTPAGLLYTDDMDEHGARSTLTMTVPADTTLRLQLYMLEPKGTRPGPVAFQIKATDREAGQDQVVSTFSDAEGNGQ